jgi:hypothetical protein
MGGSEGHEVGKPSGFGDTHGSAALKIGGHHQRRSGEPLHVGDEGCPLIWLSWNNIAVAYAPGNHKTTYVIVVNPAHESLVFRVIVRRIIAVTAHHDELRDSVMQRKTPKQRRDGWALGIGGNGSRSGYAGSR